MAAKKETKETEVVEVESGNIKYRSDFKTWDEYTKYKGKKG